MAVEPAVPSCPHSGFGKPYGAAEPGPTALSFGVGLGTWGPQERPMEVMGWSRAACPHRCHLSLGGHGVSIQTYTWTKSTYGHGKKYIAAAYVISP